MDIEPLIPLLIFLGTWIIVTIPVYISARILTIGNVGFGRAMLATFVGPLMFITVFFISLILLGSAISNLLTIAIALILSIIAWLGTFKVIFNTTWLRSIAIVIIALIIFIITVFIIGLILLFLFPTIPKDMLPIPIHQISV